MDTEALLSQTPCVPWRPAPISFAPAEPAAAEPAPKPEPAAAEPEPAAEPKPAPRRFWPALVALLAVLVWLALHLTGRGPPSARLAFTIPASVGATARVAYDPLVMRVRPKE